MNQALAVWRFAVYAMVQINEPGSLHTCDLDVIRGFKLTWIHYFKFQQIENNTDRCLA